MGKIPDEKLEELMNEADVGPRTKRKLRKANEQTASDAPARGHGAPAPISRSIGEI